jgi:hypothetical protein
VKPGDSDALDERLAAALAALTPAQRERALAHLGGESTTAIAVREGVSPQAVDQSLRSPAVQAFYSIAGHRYMVGGLKRGSGGEMKLIPVALFENLVTIALAAERPVIFGASYALVPDYNLRLEATLKVIELIVPPDGAPDCPPVQSPHESGAGEVVAREKTTVSRTREIRRRVEKP